MKQTAVKFLVWKLNNIKSTSTDQYGKIIFLEKEFYELIEKAKEIEKQQIKDAYISGMYDAHSKTSIDYYKENYETTV